MQYNMRMEYIKPAVMPVLSTRWTRRRMDTPLADGKGLREFYNRGTNAYGPRGPFRMILL